MSVEIAHGNLLTAPAEALVNTVNTRGVMGKGIALQFKRAFPQAFREYERACRAGEVVIGSMHVVEQLAAPRYIINFPTKDDWRQPSRLAYIDAGLADLVRVVRRLGVNSIAIPPLGCGNGGLVWSDVRPRIEAAFAELPEVRVLLFAPDGAPAPSAMVEQRARPNLSKLGATVLLLMRRYMDSGLEYRLSLLEVQKLAYFFAQAAADRVTLSFAKEQYGPYAQDLQHLLGRLEGHHIAGLGDAGARPYLELSLRPGAIDEARTVLAGDSITAGALARVSHLIDGFESIGGMELLATVHWAAHESPPTDDLDTVVARVHSWNERKRKKMAREHIAIALERLQATGFAEPAAIGLRATAGRYG